MIKMRLGDRDSRLGLRIRIGDWNKDWGMGLDIEMGDW